ncbi:hypothetical protein Cantr_07330 [Candida viswanathii]|uniref:Uncharacterized protein n=1 Tax=Candida viswanathii TaxID=5486 RepID=A0A367Y009_9ASCO|nr:hypothetical protein Cantr_07330 [Candida viswanathii]
MSRRHPATPSTARRTATTSARYNADTTTGPQAPVVDESRVRTFREDKRIVYGYRHVVLDRAQTALTDSYPGHSDKLDRSRTNPYVLDHLKKVFDHGARLPKRNTTGSRRSMWSGSIGGR